MSDITDFKVIYRLALKRDKYNEIIDGLQVFVNLENKKGLIAIFKPGEHGVGEAMRIEMEAPAMVRMAKIILRMYAKIVREEEEKQEKKRG